ncbi:hypothetical protein AAT19DRAFT_12478 [Rhodotorula toruloides]|uniref:Uncharacterized protein n=1 Tax=Rhodotorula toruloides TaxID=5286 RepID=A0A2T0AGE3_RHOTO|nr:hypothetical protein AAT19DRAFT_12478 [Rhodotorula toruloides]
MSYCKCVCFGNSTIIPLYRPAIPSNPCLSCTRQFCLDQKLAACVGAQNPEEDPDTATGEGGDVEARCFQRDSPKSHFIVISFLVITSTLLVLAVLKQYGLDLQAVFARSGLKAVAAVSLPILCPSRSMSAHSRHMATSSLRRNRALTDSRFALRRKRSTT